MAVPSWPCSCVMRAAWVCLALNGITLLHRVVWRLDAGTALFWRPAHAALVAITMNFLLIDTALTAASAFLLRGMEGP